MPSHKHQQLVEQVRQMHYNGTVHEKFHRHSVGGYLKDFVYGANDGIITTFAVVAGVAGANLSSQVVLILGFASLLADGFSMAMSNYLGEKSNRDYVAAEQAREEWEVTNLPHEERQEIYKLYERKGFSGALLNQVVNVITANKKLWVNEMMIGEHGLIPNYDYKSPWRNAAVTFGSFVVTGLVPLMPYVVGEGSREIFPYAVAATASILFVVGSLRTFITQKNWWISGLEMLVVGAVAAAVAYGVGSLLASWA